MYDFVSGRLAVRKPSFAVIDAGGVGYRVEIPLSTYEKLPREGTVKLFTYLRVSEDAHRLYGFATEREREIFLRLVEGVQQLGPSKAVAILSATSPEDLVRAIEEGDVAFLKNIKGIGEKIANRLVVELRGKLPEAAGKTAGDSSLTRDGVGALVALGYDRRQAEEAVRRAQKDLGPDAPVEDVIKRSLQHV
ncbi:MAG TPA: Holliday junction branch migration protein RuvA [Planctomycetota bacterium]|nr:Holliday junction branch migration protein RuvA [Planctomycetota bacterium]